MTGLILVKTLKGPTYLGVCLGDSVQSLRCLVVSQTQLPGWKQGSVQCVWQCFFSRLGVSAGYGSSSLNPGQMATTGEQLSCRDLNLPLLMIEKGGCNPWKILKGESPVEEETWRLWNSSAHSRYMGHREGCKGAKHHRQQHSCGLNRSDWPLVWGW